MTAPRLSRWDAGAAAALFLAALLVFGAGISRLGFYTDDNNWLMALPKVENGLDLWHAMQHHMPGRNLHPLWHYLLYQTTGNDPVSHLPLLHFWQASIDSLTVAVFFLLLRLLPLPPAAALLAAGLFAFCPTHGETHFWLESLPANLLSTLFLLLFALTTLALTRGRRTAWLWLADAAAFGAALFTYDQVLPVLALIVAWRLAAVWRQREAGRLLFAMYHMPYVAGGLLSVWLLLTRWGGPQPRTGDTLAGVAANLRHTWADTLGAMGRQRLAVLLAKAAPVDWVIAAAAAGILAWVAWRAPGAPEPRRSWLLLALAVATSLLAYGPVWLWYVSPRLHYLPTVGLFGSVAVVLAAALAHLGRPSARGMLCGAAGIGMAIGAAACRGESRFWEEAFQAKRTLYAEIEPELEGKEFLVMEDFPDYHGTAQLLGSADATFAPQLLSRTPSRFPPNFRGVLGSAPAPGGLFLATNLLDGPEALVYSDGSNALVVRFLAWEGGQFRYARNPARPLPYQTVSSDCAPQPASFAVRRSTARRDGEDLVLSLLYEADLQPDRRLAAIIHFYHWDHLQPWGEPDNRRSVIQWPVMLAASAGSGGGRCAEVLRLHRFPPSSQIRLDFYASARHGEAVLLGRSDVRLEP